MNSTIVNPSTFAERMREIQAKYGADKEVAHTEADKLICQLLKELGYEEGAAVFEEANLWYA